MVKMIAQFFVTVESLPSISGLYKHFGQVENAETETKVRKQKYGSEKKSRLSVAWLTNVPCKAMWEPSTDTSDSSEH